jgi:hypothetical protein
MNDICQLILNTNADPRKAGITYITQENQPPFRLR